MATAIHHQRYVMISDPPNGISNGTENGNANGNCQCKPDTHTVGSVANGNENHSNGIDQTPLNIAIVGAGIGGLTAAIGLRRNGHKVTLYEQSRFANEVGAAIHLAPNANGILRRYGLYMETFGAVYLNHVTRYNGEGVRTKVMNLAESNKLWQHPWQLSHRVHLHDALKQAAISDHGIGKPAALHTSSRVVNVDTENATISLESGRMIKADLVLGADGVYSKMRTIVSGQESQVYGSGKAAFRFLVARSKALKNPETAKLVELDGEMAVWHGSDRRVVMYPCDSNRLLNFACIHPDTESQGGVDGWNKEASLDQLLKVFGKFPSDIQALLRMADPASIKVWKLLDMDPLPTWVKGKLALLGESAHPMLPYQGQGGGAAIEDAAAIAAVLPAGTTREEIPERLKLYEKIRYDRGHVIQEYSRQAGQDPAEGKPEINMMAYTAYNFGHDEVDYATQVFNQWQYAKNPNLRWRGPFGFGPVPGPRQDILGRPQPNLQLQTFTTATVKFKTSRTFLQNMFPTKSFGFKSPATAVFASFSAITFNNISWLGGGGYNQFGLHIHGVEYKKEDGSSIIGTYIPILFEDLADTIVAGRDDIGLPKVYCALDILRRQKSYRLEASWQGSKFLDFELQGLTAVESPTDQDTTTSEPDQGDLVYRYIPAVGDETKGKADCQYPVVIPRAEESTSTTSRGNLVAKAMKTKVVFNKMDVDALPTLHHIVDVLADIPIYEVVGAKIVQGTGERNLSNARRIE